MRILTIPYFARCVSQECLSHPFPVFQRRSITEDCQADSLQSQAKNTLKTIDYQQSLINFAIFYHLNPVKDYWTWVHFVPAADFGELLTKPPKMHHGFPQRETIIYSPSAWASKWLEPILKHTTDLQ